MRELYKDQSARDTNMTSFKVETEISLEPEEEYNQANTKRAQVLERTRYMHPQIKMSHQLDEEELMQIKYGSDCVDLLPASSRTIQTDRMRPTHILKPLHSIMPESKIKIRLDQ